MSPTRRPSGPPLLWLLPAFAMALCLLVGVFWLGRKFGEENGGLRPSGSIGDVSGMKSAPSMFSKKCSASSPNRVNWVTCVNGKVDFSISSVAYKEKDPLVPYVVTIPRAKESFAARVLLRPGDDAAAHASWTDKAVAIELKWHLDAVEDVMATSCRLMSSDRSAYLEGDTSLKPNQGTVFGSLRWGPQLLQIHLMRLAEFPKAAQVKPQL